MKIANIVTNVVLAAAIVVLFFFHFTGSNSGSGAEQTTAAELADPTDVSIAYFNMDSVMLQWDLYYEYEQEMGLRQSELETDFAGRAESFQQRMEDAQYRVERGLVTRSEAEQLQQQLAVQQQDLVNLQNQYATTLQEESIVKNRQLLDMIERYVAELSQARGYSYVYSYTFGGNLIYGAKPYNITGDVISGLNERFKTGTELD